MSKIISTNTTDLQALLEKINALPEAGSGSGGSVETCDVTITNYSEMSLEIIATVVDNGVETPYVSLYNNGYNDTTPPYTISNVKCGSIITVVLSTSKSTEPYVETDNGSTLIKACYIGDAQFDGERTIVYVFLAPTTAGVSSTIVADFE